MQNRTDAWYTATIGDATDYPALTEDCRADVAVIGGGLSGVATAVELAERGFSVVLLEANRIGWGASGRNGGQVTGSLSGDKAMLKQLRPTMGAAAEDYVWNLRWRGHQIIERRIERYAIQCDLKRGHLHAAWKPSHMPELEATYSEACQRGMEHEVELLDESAVKDYVGTDLYHGALYNSRNLHLHSLNLCLGEARAATGLGARIFEGSRVESIQHGATPIVETAQGRVTADSVILTGNAYHRLERKKLGGLLFPAVLANLTTKPLSAEVATAINPKDLAVYDTRFVLDYYRLTSDNRLMFGGGANYSGRNLEDVAGLLRPAIEKTFPQLKGISIDYEWTGQAGITINRIPQIGRLSNNVYYAQGYSGHGIATSHILAEVLAETIAGSLEEFDRLAALKPIRIPLGDRVGQSLLTLGMHYYQTLERFR
ncbi:MAG: FAD-binding oxidoreductase [Gammaproteobacteria bacterium]|nr:FAD-binding oxidoreductase [Gammaproteobacteria bacterium]